MSYAASFATDDVGHKHQEFIHENVSKLTHVSVRETSGIKILEKSNIKNATQVLDPVFLMDREYWEKLSKKVNINGFIFVYDFDNNTEIEFIARKLRDSFGWSIATVNQSIDYADHNFSDCGPQDFLGLIERSMLVLTTSFHALAFAIIFEKNVGVFNRNIGINTRMRDLLDLFNMSDKLFSSGNVEYSEFEVDYTKVNPIKESHILRSRSYLLNSLNDVGNNNG